jgi:hypothetical protein
MPFQTTINDYQAIGVAGDFASLNPYSSVLAGNSALVAPVGGLTVGNFFWVGPTGQTSQSFVSGWQIAFLGRNMQALITQFLEEATMVVPEGFMVAGYNGGDFLANFPAGAAFGNYVFADPNDGTPVANATNTAPALGVGTASAGFSGTATLNGTTTLNITAVTHGVVSVGDVVADSTTPGNIPAGTTIVAQLTGIAGGVGTYQMSQVGVAAVGDTVTTTSAGMLVTAIASGTLNDGDIFSGTAVSTGTTIVGQVAPFKGVASILTGALSTLVVTSVQPGTDLLRKGAALPAIAGLGIVANTTISTQVSGTPGGVGSYTLSAAGTVGAGVPVTTTDSLGGTGFYAFSPAPQTFGAAAVPETITVAGTAQATGFRVRGTYQSPQGAAVAPNGVWKISAPVGNAT